MGIKDKSILFIAKDMDTMMKMAEEIHNDFRKEGIKLQLQWMSKTRMVLITPICFVTLMPMEGTHESNINRFLGIRHNIVVIDNDIRFHEDFFKGVIEPIATTTMMCHESCLLCGLFIGWHQFMGDSGILKYASCDRYDFDAQYNNTIERVLRKDYHRTDVVRFGVNGEREETKC